MDTLDLSNESLREALIDAEMFKEKVMVNQERLEKVLKSLQVMADADVASVVQTGLSTITRELECDESFVVRFTERSPQGVVFRSLFEHSHKINWLESKHMSRVRSGKVVNLIDVTDLDFWKDTQPVKEGRVKSVLIAPLVLDETFQTILVATSKNRAHFNKDRMTIMRLFAPLAAQMSLRAEALKEQYALSQELTSMNSQLSTAVAKINSQKVQVRALFFTIIIGFIFVAFTEFYLEPILEEWAPSKLIVTLSKLSLYAMLLPIEKLLELLFKRREAKRSTNIRQDMFIELLDVIYQDNIVTDKEKKLLRLFSLQQGLSKSEVKSLKMAYFESRKIEEE